MIAESSLIFASHGNQIGLAKLVQGYRLSGGDGHYISTKGEGKKSIKLKLNETVLQVIVLSFLTNLNLYFHFLFSAGFEAPFVASIESTLLTYCKLCCN